MELRVKIGGLRKILFFCGSSLVTLNLPIGGFSPLQRWLEFMGAASALKKGDKKHDIRLIQPFLTAVVEVLTQQLQIEVKALKPFLKGTQSIPHAIDIAGVISLLSAEYAGSISLCFPKSTFLGVYNKMLGENQTELSNEIIDAAGEILNMVYGRAKVILNDQLNYQFQKALPTVLCGSKLTVRQTGQVPTVILAFESLLGPFHLEIELG